MNQSVEDYIKILKLNLSQIAHMDLKASFMLAYIGLLIGAVLNGTAGVSGIGTMVQNGLLVRMLVAVFVCVCLTVSLLMMLSVIVVRKGDGKKKKSVLFYGDIARTNGRGYQKRLDEMTSRSLRRDVVEQIHVNAIICERKARFYNIGVVAAFISTILLLLLQLF